MHTHGATLEENGRVSALQFVLCSIEMHTKCLESQIAACLTRNGESKVQQVKWKQKKFIHFCTIEDEKFLYLN